MRGVDRVDRVERLSQPGRTPALVGAAPNHDPVWKECGCRGGGLGYDKQRWSSVVVVVVILQGGRRRRCRRGLGSDFVAIFIEEGGFCPA